MWGKTRHNTGVNVPAAQLPPRSRPRPVLAWLGLAMLMAVYLLRVGPGVRTYSQTVDETYHIGAAVSLLEARTLVLGVQHPPLARYVMALPIAGTTEEIPEYAGATMSRKEDVAYAAGTNVLFSSQDPANYWNQLAAVRQAMLVFPLLAMLYAFLLGRYLGGNWAGLFGALLISLDATFLGHGMWAATDTAAAAGFLIAIYHGLRWIEKPEWVRAVVAGVAGGIGVSLKFSVALAAPGLVLALVVVSLARAWGVQVRAATTMPPVPIDGPPPSLPVRVGHFVADSLTGALRRVGQLVLIAVVALVTVWATYKFHVGPMGDSDTLASAPQWSRLPGWVLETPVPMPSFWIGLARLAAQSATGSDTYLFGRLSRDGWWYYFPVLLVFKTPLGLLVLMIAAAVLAFEHKVRSSPEGLLVLGGVLVPAGLFLGVSMMSGVQIGIRHLLPFLGMMYVVAAVVFTRSRLRVWGMLLLAGLAVVETGRKHPDYLAFFNLMSGPPEARDHIAADSNLDWGQDLGRLAERYQSDHRFRERLTAVFPLGSRQTPLFQALGMDPELIDAEPRSGQLVAVSITRMKLDPERFRMLDGSTEVGRIGDGFVIYEYRPVSGSSF